VTTRELHRRLLALPTPIRTYLQFRREVARLTGSADNSITAMQARHALIDSGAVTIPMHGDVTIRPELVES